MAKTLSVLLSAPYMLPMTERFRPVFERYGLELIVASVEERLSEEQLLTYAGKIDGVICGDDRFTARVLEACAPRLKIISKWGTGIDSIDKDTAANLGIQVSNTPNAFTTPVADSVLGYILAFSRRQPWLDAEMKLGRWQKIPGSALGECTLGVIGVGNVGRAVLRRANAFGMRLLGTDIVEIPADFIAEMGVEMTDLEALLSQSDFISINCDLNPSSHHLINQQTLELMQPEAVLINTARGAVVDEAALISALKAGKIGGAALDVFEVEPLPADSPLLSMQNVMLAPHNANSSPTAWEHVHWNSIRNLLEGLGISAEDLNPADYP
ncbi:MAG: phosphoglycerate dehydrogenase [Chloroflexi bacterium]|nr:phosphoglycerate dehydrogenase [Chloroflexota bacterium]